MRLYTHSLHRRALATWLGVGLAFACATPERAFKDNQADEVGGSSAGTSSLTAGMNATAGKTNSGGSANGGARTSAGDTGNGGATNNGGTATSSGGVTSAAGAWALGGTNAVAGGTSSGGGSAATTGGFGTTGGSIAVGGGSAVAGGPAGTGGVRLTGGASNNGGTATSVGGTPLSTGGAPVTTGGASNATGGNKATGGAAPTGGNKATGGAATTGGSPGAGGSCVATQSPEATCDDGIDNDCNGAVDCPIVKARYPEPGGASAGDDASVTLAPPVQVIARVECRSGKPSAVATKAWVPCDSTNPTALTVYSMSSVEAQTVANNGVTEFQFRFVYSSGGVSDPRSVVYYAHNSLWEDVPRTPRDACTPIQPDNAYFATAKPYIAPDTTTPAFAAADTQLKRPFVFFRFAPKYINDFVLATAPREIKLLSLRHRFVVDPNRQMLLVTRAYKSTRAGTCGSAEIFDHETHMLGAARPIPWFMKGRHYKVPCDAIVMNKAGTGVCLGTSGTVVKLMDPNSSMIVPLLQTFGIAWPQADPMMWQKLFKFIPARSTLQFFSDKCATEDTACQTKHPGVPILPDSSDTYFTTP